MQNGFIRRFNRSFREAVLNMYIFESLEEVKTETEKWLDIYNQHRPHDSLGNLSPIEYLQKVQLENCNLDWSNYGSFTAILHPAKTKRLD